MPELDRALHQDRTALTEATADWQDVASTWLSIANGAPPFDLPDDADQVGVIQSGDRTIFNTGAGDDTITIEVDKETGDQIVTINGQVYRVPAGEHVVIRAGEGNDEIRVPDGWDIDFTALGGEGDDAVHGGAGDETVLGLDGRDRIGTGEGDDYGSGGADRDYLDGGEGDDTLSGGTGDDTAYGLDGDDAVTGGDGADYLEGGAGDDTVAGGDGADVLSGGADDDAIHGGGGDDVSYAGTGDDATHAGSGSDTSHSEAGDSDTGAEHRVTVEIKGVPDYIEIEGSPEFVARVRADLEMLASSPRGQMMLENLLDNYENSGILGIGRDGLTIREEHTDGNSAYEGAGGSGNVNYNPSRDYSVDDRPPVVGLYHELSHVYDYVNETKRDGEYDGDDTTDHGIDVDERQGTGLPIDHDDDPDTPEVIDPEHPVEYTENGLREELGLDDREHYVG